MISALHPVNLPMKKYPAAIQMERLMNIFWLDSTCALTDHLTSIKIIEKEFLSFASLPVSKLTCVSILYLSNPTRPPSLYKIGLKLANGFRCYKNI